MRVESEKITKRLDGNNCTWNGTFFPATDGIFDSESSLKKDFQGFPPATTEAGQQASVIKKILAEDLRTLSS